MLYTKLKHRTSVIKDLTRWGIINPNWIRDIRIFESFHDLPEELCTYCKYELVAEQEGVSSYTVKKIVLKLRRD